MPKLSVSASTIPEKDFDFTIELTYRPVTLQFRYVALSNDFSAQAMEVIIQPTSNVVVTTWPLSSTFPRHLSLRVLPFIFASVCPLVQSFAVHLAILKITCVPVAVQEAK